jgi:hypothetical protein
MDVSNGLAVGTPDFIHEVVPSNSGYSNWVTELSKQIPARPLPSTMSLFLWRLWSRVVEWRFNSPFFFVAQQPIGGNGFLIVKVSLSYSDTSHSVTLLWTTDQPVAETSTWQHTTLTTDRHPWPRRDSHSQSQQANDRRPTMGSVRFLHSLPNLLFVIIQLFYFIKCEPLKASLNKQETH